MAPRVDRGGRPNLYVNDHHTILGRGLTSAPIYVLLFACRYPLSGCSNGQTTARHLQASPNHGRRRTNGVRPWHWIAYCRATIALRGRFIDFCVMSLLSDCLSAKYANQVGPHLRAGFSGDMQMFPKARDP
jgi:hypothetical protein